MAFASAPKKQIQDTEANVLVLPEEKEKEIMPMIGGPDNSQQQKEEEIPSKVGLDGDGYLGPTGLIGNDHDPKETFIEKIETEIKEDVLKVKKWFGQTIFEDKKERFGFIAFMIPVILLSIVSTLSLIEFFALGHPGIGSIILAAAFEGASFASIAALVLLKKLSKWALWSLILILFLLQAIGNIYVPFIHLNPASAKGIFDLFGLAISDISSKRIIALIQGISLPICSLLMFKITSVMFKNKENDRN